MSAVFDQLFGLGQTTLLVTLAVFFRVGGAMALLPAFGERSVPERVRLILAIAFTIVVAPSVAPMVTPVVEKMSGLPLWLGGEILAGLAIGIVIRLFVHVLQIAGTIAAQSTSLAQIFGGQTVDPQPAIGHVLLVGGLALAVMLGLHVRLAELLIISFDILPPAKYLDAAVLTEWGVNRIAKAFALAFTLAAPFLIVSLIYNVALGVINRAMPQLMVAFVGAPAITAGGLILLAITAPILLEVWRGALFAFLADPFGAP